MTIANSLLGHNRNELLIGCIVTWNEKRDGYDNFRWRGQWVEVRSLVNPIKMLMIIWWSTPSKLKMFMKNLLKGNLL